MSFPQCLLLSYNFCTSNYNHYGQGEHVLVVLGTILLNTALVLYIQNRLNTCVGSAVWEATKTDSRKNSIQRIPVLLQMVLLAVISIDLLPGCM